MVVGVGGGGGKVKFGPGRHWLKYAFKTVQIQSTGCQVISMKLLSLGIIMFE